MVSPFSYTPILHGQHFQMRGSTMSTNHINYTSGGYVDALPDIHITNCAYENLGNSEIRESVSRSLHTLHGKEGDNNG